MEIQNLPLTSVTPSPMNPRKTFDEGELQELADNIKQQGLLQPITVRSVEYMDYLVEGEVMSKPVKYEVVCGERRYRACKLNGSETIAAIVREMTDDEAFDAMITENLQRKDVDPIEEAFAFKQLISKGSTAEEVAVRFGKSVRFVQDRVKLNNLIPELLAWVREGKLPLVSAMIVAKLRSENQEGFAKSTSYMSQVPKETTMNFVNNLFCYLEHTPWAKESTPYTGGCGIACAECPRNSSNAGCLFYEMKADPKSAKCTDREKMTGKLLAYFKDKLLELDTELVKKGGSIERGKAVLVDNGARYNGKDLYESALAVISDLGYEVYEPSHLGPRCWYGDGDERIPPMLENGDVIKAYSFGIALNGTSVLTPEYFYTKKQDGQPVESREQQEAMRLAGQYAQVESDVMSGISKALIKKLQELPPETTSLCKAERTAIVATILIESDHDAKRMAGIENARTAEIFDRVEGHPEIWGMILRNWAFSRLASIVEQQWRQNESVDKAVRTLAEVLMPHDYEQAMTKAEAAIEKKQSKLKKALEELGYGTDGKKLEYKDTTHYTEC